MTMMLIAAAVGIGMTLGIVISHAFTRPLNEVDRVAEAVAADDQGFPQFPRRFA